jgi:hypothetical protein
MLSNSGLYLHVVNSNDCFVPLAPKLENTLLEFAESHLRQWGSSFFATSPPVALVRMEMRLLLVFDKDEVAGFLENNVMDTTLPSRKTCSCCTIAPQT